MNKTSVNPFTGKVDITSTLGVNDGSSASAGDIGEVISSAVSVSANYTTTATYQLITSITLTAGDWDISALGTFNANLATLTPAANAIFVISNLTASSSGSTEGISIVYAHQSGLSGTTAKQTVTIPSYQVSISTTTTYYFNTQATFTAGNPTYVGSIRARRLR